MKKKIYACTAALFLSAAALAACSGQSGAAAQTQPIAAGPETQPIAAGQETVTAGSQDTALNVTPSESAQAQTPAAGDSVEIAAQPSTAASAFISEADAKKAAFDHAGVTEADVTGLRVKLDYDDGRQVYDVEFYSGNQEYDYEISATDGTVLSFDQEMDDWARAQNSASAAQGAGTNAASAALSEADAKALALAQVPGATEENIVKFGLDYDDGRSVYEIEIRYEYAEYEIEIDAATGDIVKLEKD